MPPQLITPAEILAHWGYSEIVDSHFAHYYNALPSIGDLRTSRRNKVPLKELSPGQRNILAAGCRAVRVNLIGPFFDSVAMFGRIALTRDDVGRLLVPPIITQENFVQFSEFVTTFPPDERPDAWVDPITVGHFNSQPVLLDGYHRAAAFWRRDRDALLEAYLPAD